MTFLALVVSSMEVIQPAAAARVLAAGLMARMHLGLVGVDPQTFQRRQAISPAPSCDSLCAPIINTVASNVCHIICTARIKYHAVLLELHAL